MATGTVHAGGVLAKVAVVLVALVAGLGGGAGSASAHSSLVSSTPAADAVLDQVPSSIELVFNQDISQSFATVVLTDSSGEQRQLSEVAVSGPTVSAPIQAPLQAGRHTIGYRVLSADGHPITGEVPFSVISPATGSAPASVGPNSPAGQSAVPRISAGPAPQAVENSTGGKLKDNWIVFVLVGGALVGLIAIGALLVFSSDRNRDDRDPS